MISFKMLSIRCESIARSNVFLLPEVLHAAGLIHHAVGGSVGDLQVSHLLFLLNDYEPPPCIIFLGQCMLQQRFLVPADMSIRGTGC